MRNDVRIAFRGLRRTPLATIAVLLVVALGTGAAATAFALLDAAFLRPLPYGDADRLVALFRVERQGTEPRNPAPPADYMDWRQSDAFETVVAARVWSPTLTGAGEPARIPALLATPGLFDLLRVPAAIGRVPAAGESGVVIGYGLWQGRFGADPAIVGRDITLDGERHTIVGVMPRAFRFPPFWATGAELWAPLVLSPAQAADRRASFLRVFARLEDGVTVEAAQAAMAGLGERLATAFPTTNEGVGIRVEPLHEPAVAGSRSSLLLIGAAVGLLLLITCANVASVLLARALGRRGDVAVRVALGAGRRELVRQGLAEGLLLTTGGGVLGVVLGLWALRMVTAYGPAGLTPAGTPAVDLRVAAFAMLVSLVAGMAAGALPALRLRRTEPAEVLRTRTGTSGDARIRDALVIGEVALASALVAAAAAVTSALAEVARRDPGFDTDVVATVVAMPGPRYVGADAQLRMLEDVRTRLLVNPSVRAVGMVNHVPVAGDLWRGVYEVEGANVAAAPGLTAAWRVVAGDYFDAIGIPLVRGQPFGDVRAGSDPVAIINESFARRAFGDADPIGRRIRSGTGPDAGPWMRVVGVAANAAQTGADVPVIPEVLVPWAQNPAPWFREAGLIVRMDGERIANVAALVTTAVHAVDPDLPVEASRRMADVLGDTMSDRSFTAFALSGFGVAALFLAAVGLHAVLLQLVRLRGHEIAIRLALGASVRDVTGLVLGHALRLTGLGVAGGAAIAAAGAGAGLRLLPGAVQWPVVLVSVLASLALAVLAAAAVPFRIAARTDTAGALRDA